jgi:branched-chain amino acid transport system permease protein
MLKFDFKNKTHLIVFALFLLMLPLALQGVGNFWVRVADMALLYVLLALGLNIVVGFAGLLDLGFVAFFAIGAYMYGLMASPHLFETFPAIARMFPEGLHTPIWVIVPAAAYLAIVTLGFGEIIRVFMNNLDHPLNITNGPKGLILIDPMNIFGYSFGKGIEIFGYKIGSLVMYYYLFIALVVISVILCHRLELSRIGRAWMAIREDEIAAKAMGINTRNLKLLAFGMGATFGGVSGSMFAAFQGFISPESFSLMESVMIVAMITLGGLGHLPGVIIGALLLSTLPEVLRWVSGVLDLQAVTGGRIDASILRQLLIALAMIIIMLMRPRGLWPSPDHGKSLENAAKAAAAK